MLPDAERYEVDSSADERLGTIVVVGKACWVEHVWGGVILLIQVGTSCSSHYEDTCRDVGPIGESDRLQGFPPDGG